MFLPNYKFIFRIRQQNRYWYHALKRKTAGDRRIRSMKPPVHGNCHAQKLKREGDQPGRLTACNVFSVQHTAAQKNGQPLKG